MSLFAYVLIKLTYQVRLEMKDQNGVDSRSFSTNYQIALFVLAIAGAGMLLLYYPDPKPLLSAPLPDNIIVVKAAIVSNPTGRGPQTYPAVMVNVTFHLVSTNGRVSEYGVLARTNVSGSAVVRLDNGSYIVKVEDWGEDAITVAGDGVLIVRRFELEEPPTAIRVMATSKDWVISPQDVMEIVYYNRYSRPVLLRDVSFQGRALESIKCKREAPSNPNCDALVEVEPGKEWRERFENPSGISIPWDIAKRSVSISIHISYTEFDLKT
jgi:hypothetical protein